MSRSEARDRRQFAAGVGPRRKVNDENGEMTMRLRFAAFMLLAIGLVVAEPRAQNPAPAPNPLGQPLLDPNGFVRDDAMLRTPILAADARYAAIEGRRLRQFLMEVDAISLKDKAKYANLRGLMSFLAM